MKTIQKLSTVSLITLLFLLLIAPLLIPKAHAAANLYFTPSSSTSKNGSQITVGVYGSGDSINAAQIDISYSTSQLEFISYSLAGSSLPSEAINETTAGNIDLAIYSRTAKTGNDMLLATFTFKALVGSGTTSLTLLDSSSLMAEADPISVKVAGGGARSTINFTGDSVASPPTTPTQTKPSPGTSTTVTATKPNATQPPTSSAAQPAPTQPAQPTVVPPSTDKTPPVIHSISPTGYFKELISLKIITDEPTKAIIKFGKSQDELNLSTSVSDYSTAYFAPFGEVSGAFAEDTTIFYMVETIDAAGNKTSSGVSELKVEAIKVTLTIQDAKGVALKNTTVIINGKEHKTDKNGLVTVSGLIPGLVSVSVKNGETIEHFGDVTTVAGVKNQAFIVSPGEVAGATTSKLPISTNIIGVVSAAIVGLIGSLLLIHRISVINAAKKEDRLHSMNPWGNAVHSPETVGSQPPASIAPVVSQQPAPVPAPNPSSTPHQQPNSVLPSGLPAPETVITPTGHSAQPAPTGNITNQDFTEAAKNVLDDKS